MLAATAAMIAPGAEAHHGFGLFDRTKDAVITGTIKSIDFVNPHSYLYLDADVEGDLRLRQEARVEA